MTQVNEHAAARLYNLARGRGGENSEEDVQALAKLLSEFAVGSYDLGYRQAINDALLIIKTEQKNAHSEALKAAGAGNLKLVHTMEYLAGVCEDFARQIERLATTKGI